jgi:hypothetical protein
MSNSVDIHKVVLELKHRLEFRVGSFGVLSLLNSVYSVDRHTQTVSAALSRESWLVVTRHTHTHRSTMSAPVAITLWNCLARYTLSSQPVFCVSGDLRIATEVLLQNRLQSSPTQRVDMSVPQTAHTSVPNSYSLSGISSFESWFVDIPQSVQCQDPYCLDERSSISDGNRLCPDLPRGPPSLLCSGYRRVKLTAQCNAFTRPRFSVVLYSYRARLGPPSVL